MCKRFAIDETFAETLYRRKSMEFITISRSDNVLKFLTILF